MPDVALKNGKVLHIQKLIVNDAKLLVDYSNLVGGELNQLGFGKNEFPLTLEAVRNSISCTINSDSNLMVFGIIDDEIVSTVSLFSNRSARRMHVADVGITVRKSYWNQGIGSVMLEYTMNFVRSSKTIKKVNIDVKSDNQYAIKLYEKFGFKNEGLRTRALKIDNQFYDLALMGLEIN
jgi:RimJ/RimL family protein N-acetyltransferase